MQWSKTQLSVITVVAVTSFMATFLISSVNIALPAIEKSFNLNAVTLSWVVTSFLLAVAMFLLPVGRRGDLTGIRRLFKIGVLIFTVSSLACALATSGFWLIAARYIQGVGGAFTSTTGPAILVSSFLPKHRGRVLGIAVSAVYLGLAFGPFAGGFMTEYLGWRSIFYFSALLGLLVSVLAFKYIGKDDIPETKNKKMDLKGSFFYMFGLVALVYGSSYIPETKAWIAMAAGLPALLIFWLLESRSNYPVIETKLFTRNKLFAYSNLAALINYSATFAIIFLLSLYLQKIQGLSPRDAGMVLIAQPIMMALLSPWAGRLSDRVQPRFPATLGMSMCTLGLAAMAFLGTAAPLWIVILLLIWVGFGFALFSSPNMNTIMGSVKKTQYGLASGSAATMRVIGQIFSMTVATLFIAAFLGRETVESAPDKLFMQVFRWAFISFTLISTVGIYFSYYRGDVSRKDSDR